MFGTVLGPGTGCCVFLVEFSIFSPHGRLRRRRSANMRARKRRRSKINFGSAPIRPKRRVFTSGEGWRGKEEKAERE